jgi:catechol 2,3-dioxygenase-like lactoylglutathione lyase family enzyme
VDSSAAWYTTHFGFRLIRPPLSPRPGVHQAILERDGFYLELASLPGSRPRPAALATPGQNASLQGVYKLAFWVPDADSAWTALRAAGVAIRGGIGVDSALAGGTRFFLLADPDGTVLQVFGPLL